MEYKIFTPVGVYLCSAERVAEEVNALRADGIPVYAITAVRA